MEKDQIVQEVLKRLDGAASGISGAAQVGFTEACRFVAIREVEDEIERRGLMQRYLEELCRIVNRTTEPTTWGEIAEMMMATAEQRLQAAYEVIFETQQGEEAAEQFYRGILSGAVEFQHNSPADVLVKMGMVKIDPDTGEMSEIKKKDMRNVTRLLNRVLNLSTKEQNEVFDYFVRTFEATVAQAIANGTLDTGVQEVRGESTEMVSQKVIARDEQREVES